MRTSIVKIIFSLLFWDIYVIVLNAAKMCLENIKSGTIGSHHGGEQNAKREIHFEGGKLSLFDKRHGKWLDFYNNFSTAECSICGNCFETTIDGEISRVLFEGFKQAYKFCPNCGAKMDEQETKIGETHFESEGLSLNDFAKAVHENAVAHGWWKTERTFYEIIALCHSELSETLEEYRKGKQPTETYYNDEKPEGIPFELADCIIRILDYCAKAGIDIETAILEKHEYNKRRPYKHGGKIC